MHQRTISSFLRTSTTWDAHADFERFIMPLRSCSLKYFSFSISNPWGVLLSEMAAMYLKFFFFLHKKGRLNAFTDIYRRPPFKKWFTCTFKWEVRWWEGLKTFHFLRFIRIKFIAVGVQQLRTMYAYTYTISAYIKIIYLYFNIRKFQIE